MILHRLIRATRGSAAVEMALVAPLLLILLCGSVELGNYFLDEHRLVKAVRDGARYAARQDLTYFTGCSGAPADPVDANTKAIVMTGLLSGGTNSLPDWQATDITLDTTCTTSAGGETLGGFYANVKNTSGTVVGAPIVTVTAQVPYTPVLAAFGFTGIGLNLNASQQAAVIGW